MMVRWFQLLIVQLCCATVFAQNMSGTYTNNQQQTATVTMVRSNAIAKNNRLLDYQQGITVDEGSGMRTLTAKDISSFSIPDGDEMLTFDSIDGLFFALRMYTGKATLHKYLRKVESFSNPGLFRVYLIRKQGETNMKQFVAMGLSRLLTRKTMLPGFEDCPVLHQKIKDDTLDAVKIKDEQKLIDFVKLYEADCVD